MYDPFLCCPFCVNLSWDQCPFHSPSFPSFYDSGHCCVCCILSYYCYYQLIFPIFSIVYIFSFFPFSLLYLSYCLLCVSVCITSLLVSWNLFAFHSLYFPCICVACASLSPIQFLCWCYVILFPHFLFCLFNLLLTFIFLLLI